MNTLRRTIIPRASEAPQTIDIIEDNLSTVKLKSSKPKCFFAMMAFCASEDMYNQQLLKSQLRATATNNLS